MAEPCAGASPGEACEGVGDEGEMVDIGRPRRGQHDGMTSRENSIEMRDLQDEVKGG